MADDLNNHTADAYLNALERLMIIEDEPAWAPHLRSRSRLRGAPKRHYVDPSLAVAALRADPDSLLRDLNLFGFLFESLVVRDLRIYAQHTDAEVLQYRDNTGLEVDAIVQRPDGPWAAFEVKLGAGMIDHAAANLLRFARRVDTSRSRPPPAALAVIVARGLRLPAPRRDPRNPNRNAGPVGTARSTQGPHANSARLHAPATTRCTRAASAYASSASALR